MESGYAPVNGLEMYYEIHGSGGPAPLVLLHGAFSAIPSSFGTVLPALTETRQVIAFEYQAHGRTADIDRPMRIETLADDVAAALRHLGVEQADVFGYSTGGSIGLQAAIRHPGLVRKLVVASVGYRLDGIHPGLMDGLGEMTPDMMHGSPWHDEYLELAPRPEDFPRLFAKKSEMDQNITDVPEETIRELGVPTLLIIGDSDLITPEHAVQWFRLIGGGVFGDMPPGLPDSQLAVLPGTSHTGMADRAAMLSTMIPPFLDAPAPESPA